MQLPVPIEVVDMEDHNNIDRAKKFDVRALPTLILVTDSDVEVSRKVGGLSAQQLKDWIDRDAA